jgi:UDP-N-acetylglucosamine transferase subunit ALG13
MIFISYGTEKYKFDRLTIALENLIYDEKYSGESFIVQMGYSFKNLNAINNIKSFDFCNNDDFNEYIKNADCIITHGGVGNIFTILKSNKIPIVIPRLKKYGEHVDDHQIQIVEELAKRKLIIPLLDISNLKEYLINHKLFSTGITELDFDANHVSEYINEKYLSC